MKAITKSRDSAKLAKLVHVTGCNLSSYLTDTEYIQTSGASYSIMLGSKLIISDPSRESLDIILKCKPARNPDANDNSFQVEIHTYSHVINKLYFGYICPHLIPCIAKFRCSDFITSTHHWSFVDERERELVHQKWRTSRDFGDMQCSAFSADVLILPKSPGVTLWDYMTKSIDLDNEQDQAKVMSLLFQLTYTLHCFSGVGLRHNDLHFGNIFVETECPIAEISYVLDQETVYVVPTNGVMAKIYDFDRASVEGEIPNNILDSRNYCQDYGTCNGRNPVFDIYSLVSCLYFEHMQDHDDIPLKQDLKKVIEANAESAKLYFEDRPRFRFKSLMCDLEPSRDVCIGDYQWRGKALPTPETFIRTLQTFQAFKRTRVDMESLKNTTVMFANEALRDQFCEVGDSLLPPPIWDFAHLSELGSYSDITVRGESSCSCREEQKETWPQRWSARHLAREHPDSDNNTRKIIEALNWMAAQIEKIPAFRFMDDPQVLFDMYDHFIEYCLGLTVAVLGDSDLAWVAQYFLRIYYSESPVELGFERKYKTTFEYLFTSPLRTSELTLWRLALMYTNPRWILLSSMQRSQWFQKEILLDLPLIPAPKNSPMEYVYDFSDIIWTARAILKHTKQHENIWLLSESTNRVDPKPRGPFAMSPDSDIQDGIFVVSFLNTVSHLMRRHVYHFEMSESRRLFGMYDDIIRVCINEPKVLNQPDPDTEEMALLLLRKHYGVKDEREKQQSEDEEDEEDDEEYPDIKEPWEWGRYKGQTTFEYLFCCGPDLHISQEDRVLLLAEYDLTLTLLALMYTNPRWVLFPPLRRALWIKNQILNVRQNDAELDAISCGPVHILRITHLN